jgi:putative ABC transport system permease protein
MKKISEAFKVAVQAMRSNISRTFLTMLGIIIGVFSVIALIAVVSGLRNRIVDEVQDLGANNIIVNSGVSQTFGIGSSLVQTPSVITDKDVEDIAKLDHVVSSNPMNAAVVKYKYKDKNWTDYTLGRPATAFGLTFLHIEQGKPFTKDDFDQKKRVTVLMVDLAKELFGDEDPVGKTIQIDNQDYEVLGTVSIQGTSLIGSGLTNASLQPTSTLLAKLGTTKYSSFWAEVSDKQYVEEVAAAMKDVLNKNHDAIDYTVLTQKDIVGTIDSILNTLTLGLSLVTAVSLIVGGIGIMNIMLVSVTERTREIGLRKAVGATNFDILIQFLFESFLISILGGLIGLGLSYGTSLIIQHYFDLPVGITWGSAALSIGVSGVVGIIFGIIPAVRAARKRPIEALRYE